jgi:hypothetical protein
MEGSGKILPRLNGVYFAEYIVTLAESRPQLSAVEGYQRLGRTSFNIYISVRSMFPRMNTRGQKTEGRSFMYVCMQIGQRVFMKLFPLWLLFCRGKW